MCLLNVANGDPGSAGRHAFLRNALTVKSPMDMELFKSSVAAVLMALTFVAVWVVTP